MDNATEEEPTEFLEPAEEIVESVEQHVEHEEVLEEIVDGDEMMYDVDGRLVPYQNVMMYEDGTEVIEEYVEVEDMGNGTYAYVVTDADGNRRLLKSEEVEAVKKEMPLLSDEFVDPKAHGTDEAGPSTSGYPPKPRGRFPGTKPPVDKSSRATMRDLLGKSGAVVYVDREAYHYHESPAKRMSDMAKVDVEKYVPTATVNRRPLPDSADFVKPKQQRSRKNPPWQDEQPSSSRPLVRIRSTSPIPVKEPLFPEEDDMVVRFRCHECEAGFPIMDRLCEHMSKNHECQAVVRELEFFNERDFESFLFKIEKQSLEKEADPSKTFAQSRKSRTNSSQTFVCNYMNKKKSKYSEFAEVNMASLADRPMEACTAFVQKTHSYECIRVKYCDHHIHFDGNIGFRVPITVKRRLFELSIKRLPIPCMQVLLAHEAENLLPHPTRFEEKLKNMSHVEIVELLGLITANLPKTSEGLQPIRGKKVPVKFESVTGDDGQETLVVVRANPPSPKPHRRSEEQPLHFAVDGEDVPMMAREEEVEQEEEEPTPPTASGGVMDEKMLYDPENLQDPRLEELSEVELGILEAYERDIGIQLSEDQKKARNTYKSKFQLAKVLNLFNSLDAATHGLSSNELHLDTINKLRDMASYVVELVCTLDAEIRVQYTPSFNVEDIKRDMIAGIAMQERVYQPDRRRRSGNSTNASPMKPYQPRHLSRTQEEYTDRIFSKVKAMHPPHRTVGINMSGTFDLNRSPNLHHQLEHLHSERLVRGGPLLHEETPNPDDQKPSTSGLPPLPEAFKAVPWSKPSRKRLPADPNAPSKKRGRPNKKADVAVQQEGQITSGALIASEVPPKAPPTRGSPAPAPAETEKPAATSSEAASGSKSDKPVVEKIPIAQEQPTDAPDASDAPVTSVTDDQLPKEDQTKVVKPVPEDVPDAPVTPSTVPSVSSIPTPTTTTRTGRIVKPKKWGDE